MKAAKSDISDVSLGGFWTRIGVALAAVITLAVTASAEPAPSTARHPRHNIAAKPSYAESCAHYRSSSRACITRAVAAINRARAMEAVGPMILPRNFARLDYAEQVFVVVDLERVDRGLRPFKGLVRQLSNVATTAARANVDPQPAAAQVGHAHVADWAGNWSSNFGPLAADYGWMYDDGYGSYNVDCSTPGAPGCWGHRDIVLDPFAGHPLLITGAGAVEQRGLVSIAQLFVAGDGPEPRYTYTWRTARRHGAGG